MMQQNGKLLKQSAEEEDVVYLYNCGAAEDVVYT